MEAMIPSGSKERTCQIGRHERVERERMQQASILGAAAIAALLISTAAVLASRLLKK
jgi:hypothetical protein